MGKTMGRHMCYRTGSGKVGGLWCPLEDVFGRTGEQEGVRAGPDFSPRCHWDETRRKAPLLAPSQKAGSCVLQPVPSWPGGFLQLSSLPCRTQGFPLALVGHRDRKPPNSDRVWGVPACPHREWGALVFANRIPPDTTWGQ